LVLLIKKFSTDQTIFQKSIQVKKNIGIKTGGRAWGPGEGGTEVVGIVQLVEPVQPVLGLRLVRPVGHEWLSIGSFVEDDFARSNTHPNRRKMGQTGTHKGTTDFRAEARVLLISIWGGSVILPSQPS